jgi:hypothetical protein
MLKGEACVENLWSIWFELVSGSKVNFSKTSVIGINVSNNYLDVVVSFLPFLIWAPVIKTIEKQLFS